MTGHGYFQEEKTKDPRTAVYPRIRTRMDLLKGMLADYALGSAKYEKAPGWGPPALVTAGWRRFLYGCRLLADAAGDSGFDFTRVLAQYDAINHTVSVPLGDELVSSIPAEGDGGEGYSPMGLWERVRYYDSGVWVDRWVSDNRRVGDTVELAEQDDEDAPVARVPMALVSRALTRQAGAQTGESKEASP